MHMRKITYTFIKCLCLCFLFLACRQTIPKREIIDIANFPMDFKVDQFYATMKSAVKDTLYENLTGDRFSGTPIAIHHIMPKFTADTLAYFGKTDLESIEMIENLKGEFISLFAFKESKGLDHFQQLLAFIKSKYGEPKIAEGYSFRQFFTYSWDLKDRELILLVMGKDQDYISKLLGMGKSDHTSHIDTATLPVINTSLFVFNKQFDKSFSISKVKSGDFLHLEPANYKSIYLETSP